ncbi:MAG: hypothetical protein AAGK28_13880, partial [Pseudomonadota bacterium]
MRFVKALCAAAALWCMLAGLAAAQTFEIKGVAFSDSVYLSDEELQAIEDRYVGRPLVFADLEKMLGDVQTLYSRS